MGSLGTALVLLGHFWALHSATGLSVYQEPAVQKAAPGSSVTFTCQVDDAQNVEKLWVIWNKDEVLLCQARVNYRSFSQGTCGPRGRFSWRPPGVFSLQLSPMSRNDSGHYTCCFTLEIPSLEEVSGNGTRLQVEETDSKRTDARETDSFPGLYSVLLVVGMVTVTLVILGTAACIWRRCFCRHRHSGNPPENPLYSNVPYRPRHTPKKTADWPVEGKVLEGHQEDQKDQGVYATTLPKSPRPQQRLIPKTCLSPNPKIKHPVSVAGATSGQWGPRRLLEADRRMVSGPARTPPPSGRRKM